MQSIPQNCILLPHHRGAELRRLPLLTADAPALAPSVQTNEPTRTLLLLHERNRQSLHKIHGPGLFRAPTGTPGSGRSGCPASQFAGTAHENHNLYSPRAAPLLPALVSSSPAKFTRSQGSTSLSNQFPRWGRSFGKKTRQGRKRFFPLNHQEKCSNDFFFLETAQGWIMLTSASPLPTSLPGNHRPLQALLTGAAT